MPLLPAGLTEVLAGGRSLRPLQRGGTRVVSAHPVLLVGDERAVVVLHGGRVGDQREQLLGRGARAVRVCVARDELERLTLLQHVLRMRQRTLRVRDGVTVAAVELCQPGVHDLGFVRFRHERGEAGRFVFHAARVALAAADVGALEMAFEQIGSELVRQLDLMERELELLGAVAFSAQEALAYGAARQLDVRQRQRRIELERAIEQLLGEL